MHTAGRRLSAHRVVQCYMLSVLVTLWQWLLWTCCCILDKTMLVGFIARLFVGHWSGEKTRQLTVYHLNNCLISTKERCPAERRTDSLISVYWVATASVSSTPPGNKRRLSLSQKCLTSFTDHQTHHLYITLFDWQQFLVTLTVLKVILLFIGSLL